ncbi:hypothetical protein D3C76_1823180 [compost metagenome]
MNHWRQAYGRVVCCSRGKSAICSALSCMNGPRKAGLHTGIGFSPISLWDSVPDQSASPK